MSSENLNYSYPGTELALFEGCVHWKNYFASEIRPFLGASVLEVGAGIGGSTPALKKNLPIQKWHCLEPDAGLFEVLKKKVDSEGFPLSAQHGTLSDIQGEELFDSILYLDVLEHIENDQEEMLRAYKLLKKGGHLIILVPAHQFLYSEFDKFYGHFRRYNRKILKRAMPEVMQMKKMVYLDSIGLFASLANRMFLKQSQAGEKQIHFWDNFLVPTSKVVDPLLFNRFGKSLLGIWQK